MASTTTSGTVPARKHSRSEQMQSTVNLLEETRGARAACKTQFGHDDDV